MGPRLYRRLVGLLPHDFRREYGDEMCRVAEERWSDVKGDAGLLRSSLFWTRQSVALLLAAGRLRTRERGGTGGMTMDGFVHDLRHGARGLVRRPGFTMVTVLTLGLGIGATTAIFSAVNTVLLRPLPYLEADRVVVLFRQDGIDEFPRQGVSAGNMRDFRESADLFEAAGVAEPWSLDLRVDGRAMSLRSWAVSQGFFPAIGGEPLLGRTFTADDYEGGAASSIVILGHRSWVSRFGADPSIVGRTLTLNEEPFTVVGVMQPDFRFPDEAEMWVPRTDQPRDAVSRAEAYMTGVARLEAGVSLPQAESEARRIASVLEASYPRANADLAYVLVPLREHLLGDVRIALWVIMGAVGFLLLIACANVAGLMLARGAQRERDFAVRGALGAGMARLVSHVSSESILLALLGGGLGVLLTYGGIELIQLLGPEHLPRIEELRIDGKVLAFAVLTTALSAVLSGLGPSLRLSRPDLRDALGDGSRGSTVGRGQARARARLVVTQVAAAVVLLVGAGLLIRSFGVLLDQELGFDPTDRLAVQVFAYDYENNGDAQAFVEEAVANMMALPGVTGVGLTTSLPGANDASISSIEVTLPFHVADRDPLPAGQEPVAAFMQVGPGYFDVLAMDLVAGRDFDSADNLEGTRVIIVNEAFSRRHFGAGSPLGKRIVLVPGAANPVAREVVGVVRDTRPLGHASEPRPEVYVPLAQSWSGSITFVVRASLDAGGLTQPVMEAIWAANPAQSIWATAPLESLLSEWLQERRFSLLLLTAFSAIALSLAGIGLYGLVSFSVERRVGELGIRRALGGRAGDLVALVLGEGVKLAGTGLFVGLVAAWYLSRFMQGMLFEVEPTDPLTFGLQAALVLVIALLATLLPALRAVRVDPVEALRSE